MKRKKAALFLAAVLTVLTLSACGGASGGNTSAASRPIMDPSAAGGGLYYDYDYSEDALEFPEESVELSGIEPLSTEPDSRLTNAKMIYTANMEAQTTEFDTCAADLEALVEQMGGYLEYASANSYGDGYRTGTYTARIPAARFHSFLSGVCEFAHVTYQDKRSENISEAYYDLESRLVTQRTKLERLQALLARAENMEDIISIESALAETELEIEQLTGSLRHYDALVDFSTVYIQLREVSRLSSVETAPPSFASRLSSAFSDGLTGFGDFLQNLTIFLAYSWIWLLVLAAVVILIIRKLRGLSKPIPHMGKKQNNDEPPARK